MIAFLIGMYLYQVGTDFKALVIREPVLAGIPDGVYRGEYKKGHIGATVSVTVKGGQIAAIEILQGSTQNLVILADSIVEGQSLSVDAISGATWSSQAFLKAVETALTGGSTP